jgi:class 3 adenylate cyclase
VLLITWLILKDVISLSRMLERGALPQNLRERKSLSSEGETLLRSTAAFEENLKQSQASEQKWASTTSPAVLHEIRKGTLLGTTFPALVARIDLNHYTEYFVGAARAQLENFLAKFFEASEEIIPRYGGLVYQHVGDEIIFHFKEDGGPRAQMALSCIRALFQEASAIHQRHQHDLKIEFTLKASIQRGELQFHQLHKDHGFLGLPLIETARILGVVKDKTKHTLLLPRDLSREGFHMGESKDSQLYALKGLGSEVFIEDFGFTLTLEQALANLDLPSAKNFRTDADFRQMFTWARSEWRKGNIEGLRQTLLLVQKVKVKKIEFESAQLILECIRECHQGLDSTTLQNSKDYASAMWLSLAVSFIPAGRAHKQMVELFSKYLDHPDQRVQAHAVAGLSRWGIPIPGLEKKISKTQGRLWAEVVQALATIDFNDVLLHTIVAHRKSGTAENLRRCQYVSQQIFNYYQHHDPVQLESNPALRGLAEEFPKVYFEANLEANVMTKSNSNPPPAPHRGAA